MFVVRRVVGKSMSPGIMPGDVVIGIERAPRPGDIVVAIQNGREVIKRVRAVVEDRYDLRGDNPSASTDSRTYGSVSKQDILAVVMIKLPTATDPPKLTHPYARWLGLGLAIVITLFALIHLFRVDTFLPLIGESLGFGIAASYFFTVGIVVMEVFAVPILLRMKLSPLARFLSGVFAVLVPLFWVLISILNTGTDFPTAQLGEFVELQSSWPLLLANTIWLALSVYTLRLFRFDWPMRSES